MRTESEILGDMTYEQFCIIASRDPAFFIEKMLWDYKDDRPITLTPMHREWIELYLKNDRVLIEAPTGHGKSEILGIGISLWIALFQKNKQILIVSNTEPQAKGILERIMNYIADNEILKKLEPIHKDTWTKTEVILSTDVKIFCKPYNRNLRSYHVDYCFADEISQYKDHSIFERYLITRVTAKGGKLVASTTPYSAIDLAAKLLKNPVFVGRVYMAQKKVDVLNDPKKPEYKSKIYDLLEPDAPVFPEKYSIEELMKIKASIGSVSYEKEYLCNVLALEGAFFEPEYVVNCWDETIDFSMKTYTQWVYIGVDFAAGSGKDADFFVITVIETDGKKNYLKYIERHRGMPINLQKERLKELNQVFKPTAMKLDESYYGQDVVQEMRQFQLPIINCKFDHQSRKQYLLNLRRVLEGNEVNGVKIPLLAIPRKPGGECLPLTDELFIELTSFIVTKTPGGAETFESTAAHDDMVMSLALALWGANDQQFNVPDVFYT